MKRFKPKNTRSDITVLPILPGTVLLSIVMVVAFLILLVSLNVAGLVSLPGWIEGILGTKEPDGDEADRFSTEFLASLKGEEEGFQTPIYMETDGESLKAILLAAKPATAYYQSCTITRIGDGETRMTQQIFRIVFEAREHAEIISGGRLTKALTADATTLYIVEDGQGRHFERKADSLFTTDSELGLPSLARMQRMLADAEEGKYEAVFATAKNTGCIKVSFTDTASGTREVFEVIPDSGLIVAAASYLPGKDTPYYTLTTESLLYDITGFDDAIFDMPHF